MGFFKSTRVFICRHQLSHRQALPLLGPSSSCGKPGEKHRPRLGSFFYHLTIYPLFVPLTFKQSLSFSEVT